MVSLKRAKKNKHHNEAWTRQGEWFFIPAPEFDPEATKAILVKNEPISRRGSKPHVCEELARVGGTQVYSDGNQIISIEEYNKMAATNRIFRHNRFQQRTIDAGVYVRGKVRHPDHSTINLKGWHRVEMNGELVSSNVKFLD
jgi:hypothetical protein